MQNMPEYEFSVTRVFQKERIEDKTGQRKATEETTEETTGGFEM